MTRLKTCRVSILYGLLLSLALACLRSADAPAADAAPAAAPAAHWAVLVDPTNTIAFTLLHDGTTVGRWSLAGWGPNWAWNGMSSTQLPRGGEFVVGLPFIVNRAAGHVVSIQSHVSRAGPNAVTFRYDLSAAKDTPLQILTAALNLDSSIAGSFVALSAGGKETTLPLPLNVSSAADVSKVVFHATELGDITVSAEPSVNLGIDRGARFLMAENKFPAGQKTVTLTLTLPSEVVLLTSADDIGRFTREMAGPDWFPFSPSTAMHPNALKPNPLSFDDWLEKPAGKRGGVRSVGDHFQLEDGTPIKFWGTNLAYGGNCAPERPAATFTAARFAKYGVNAVRLHKFSYPPNRAGIGDALDSTRWDRKGLERLDYFSAQLKNNGVYFGWSHTFGLMIRPHDRARLAAYDEILKAYPDGNTYALINFAPDLQDLLIDMVVNLLKHRNPYTNQAYAREPALCFIELQNEDDIFFYTSEKAFNACPTYRAQFSGRFSDWLKTKYGSEDALSKAWDKSLAAGQSLAARNLVPQTNPWFFSQDHLPNAVPGERQWLLDSAAFLHAVQNQFYGKFVDAIRAAGYAGPIVGSPWQAPAMLPHYYNLRSDALAGYIDRHNYFGGDLFDTMLSHPGSGLFSTGLQQVIDRPFGFSEWITVYPSLYSAEGPAIMAAYGMGLQGWDASYEFQSQAKPAAFVGIAGQQPYGVWEADTPTQIGQYPALARMVMRGDVKEGPTISVRRVSPKELADGTFSFSDKIQQQGDVKTFAGTVPPEALAAGRIAVQFTDTPQPSTFPDMALYRNNTAGTVITSATKQLTWDTTGDSPERGFFTVNTDATKAVVGFAAGKDVALGDVHIRPDCPYASIFLTATEKQATLANAKTALLTAVARSSNRGFRYFTPDRKIIDNGRGPILLEPVKATVTMTGRAVSAVNVLDHDGNRTGRTLEVTGGHFTIDGTKDKTLYYEVVYP